MSLSNKEDNLMKKLLAIALLLLLSSSASAQEFNKFSMDIAKGWTFIDEGSVVIMAPDKEAAVSIACNTLEGVTAEAAAAAFSKKLNGSTPQEEKDGIYSFTFTSNGVESKSYCALRDNRFTLITVTDPTGKYSKAIQQMLATLKEK